MAPIGIVTVTYSPGEHLHAFAQSVPQGAHVVIVDNGSIDGAPEAVATKYRMDLLYSGGNVGYGAGMNLGVRHLRRLRDRGLVDDEWFMISNPDVVFSPEALENLLDAARRHPRAGSVGPKICEPDGSAYPSARMVPSLRVGIGHAMLSGVWPDNPWTRRYLAASCVDTEHTTGWLSGSCLLLRWDAFEAIGGFDERYFMYMEDVDLGDRLGRAGWVNVFASEARIAHAQGHAANKRPAFTLRAHHRSAYLFLADRHPGVWRAPLRAVLRAGLKVREFVVIRAWGGPKEPHEGLVC